MKKKATEAPPTDERLELLFRHAGLSEKQAKLYRLLLTSGDERVSILSQKSGMKRTNVYTLLRALSTYGIVQEFEKSGVVYFRPAPPDSLIGLLEARIRDSQAALGIARDLVPTLTSQWKAAVGRPVVRYYEGGEGVKKVFEDVYAPKDDIVYGCVDLERADEVFPKYVPDTLIPLRVKNKVVARSFVANSQQAREVVKNDAVQLRETALLDKQTYPLPAEIDVYEDKVAMMSFRNGDFIGLIVEHKDFAESLRSIMKLAFTRSTRKKKET